MTLDNLTVDFKHLDRSTLLEDWEWLIGKKKIPIMLAASGDAFLQDVESGEVHVLDVAANQVALVARTLDEFQTQLNDREFVGSFFAVQLVGDLRQSGLLLRPGTIYSFIHPPSLGGEYVLENIEVSDIEVHFSITGQIGKKTASLPDGTKLDRISISSTGAKKPWWKIW